MKSVHQALEYEKMPLSAPKVSKKFLKSMTDITKMNTPSIILHLLKKHQIGLLYTALLVSWGGVLAGILL